MAVKRKKAKRALIVVAAIVAALVIAFLWYVNDYYHADDAALAVVADVDGDADGVVVRELSDKAIAFIPNKPQAGFIFYPGAKVQPESYAPLLEQCAEQGVLCVLVKPLFNLAILDADVANGIEEQFPDIQLWVIGGHSMGGVAASDYLARHSDALDGVVFLASYPAADLSTCDDAALSIVGTNDTVLNRENYENSKAKLPTETQEIQIDGGNHAYYGNYGEQAGDGQATVSREEQQAQAVRAIVQFVEAA